MMITGIMMITKADKRMNTNLNLLVQIRFVPRPVDKFKPVVSNYYETVAHSVIFNSMTWRARAFKTQNNFLARIQRIKCNLSKMPLSLLSFL